MIRQSSILDSYDRMCALEEQVDQLKSNHEAIVQDLLSDCGLLKEKLQVSKHGQPRTKTIELSSHLVNPGHL